MLDVPEVSERDIAYRPIEDRIMYLCTLGRTAVIAEERLTQLDESDIVGHYQETVARDTSLGEIRHQLRSLSTDRKRLFSTFLWHNLSPFLNMLKRGEYSDELTEWLADKTTKDQLLNVLQYQNRAVADQQDSDIFRTSLALERSKFKDFVEVGVDQGWLHPSSEQAKREVDNVTVYVGDYASTQLQGTGGFALRDSRATVIAQGWEPYAGEDLDAHVTHAAAHEWDHVVVGQFDDRWLDEAVTAHLETVYGALHRDGSDPNYLMIDIIDPKKRYLFGGNYYDERQLLDIMLNGGKLNLSATLVTRPYSAALYASPEELEAERMQLDQALSESWGVNKVLPKISSRVKRYHQAYVKKDLTDLHALGLAAQRVGQELLSNPKIVFSRRSPLALGG